MGESLPEVGERESDESVPVIYHVTLGVDLKFLAVEDFDQCERLREAH